MRDRSRNWIEGLLSVLGDSIHDAVEPRLAEHERRMAREIQALRRDLDRALRQLGAHTEISGEDDVTVDRGPEPAPRDQRGERGRRARRHRSRPRQDRKEHKEHKEHREHKNHGDRPKPKPRTETSPEAETAAPATTTESGPALVPPTKCKQPGCWRNAFRDGFCKQHYQRIVLKPQQDKAVRQRQERTMTVAEYKEVERRLLEKAKEEKLAEDRLKAEVTGKAEPEAAAAKQPAKKTKKKTAQKAKKPAKKKPAKKKAKKKTTKKKAKKKTTKKKAKKPASKPAATKPS